MPQHAATIESLPMALEVVKEMQADGLEWGEGWRGSAAPARASGLGRHREPGHQDPGRCGGRLPPAAFEGCLQGAQAAAAWTAGRPRTLMRQSSRDSSFEVATPMGVAACIVWSVSHTTRSPTVYLWR